MTLGIKVDFCFNRNGSEVLWAPENHFSFNCLINLNKSIYVLKALYPGVGTNPKLKLVPSFLMKSVLLMINY